jgi:hypothetical protein
MDRILDAHRIELGRDEDRANFAPHQGFAFHGASLLLLFCASACAIASTQYAQTPIHDSSPCVNGRTTTRGTPRTQNEQRTEAP